MPKAIRIHETGGPEVLRYEDFDPGKPGPGQVRLKQNVAGVNFIDVYHRNGLYPLALPAVLGSEAAGVVESVGEGVKGWKVGDRAVHATAGPGAYADARVLDASKLVRIPEGISEETAAAVLLKGMTAEYLIRRTFSVKPGDTVLFHAAAGGVGLLAVPWLKALGATVIGTVGSDAKVEIARKAGCDHVIQYTQEKVASRVRELTAGKGVAVVYDSVGKATFADSLDSLMPRGMLVSFGNASGKPEPFDPLVLSQKGSLFLTRPTLFHYCATPVSLADSSRALFEIILSGKVKVHIGGVWPLKGVAEAHRALESRNTVGSCVLKT